MGYVEWFVEQASQLSGVSRVELTATSIQVWVHGGLEGETATAVFKLEDAMLREFSDVAHEVWLIDQDL